MYQSSWGGSGYYSSWGMMGPGWYGHGWLLDVFALAAPFLILIILWSLFWKGLALWHSARRGQPWWFFFLLIINSLGILEIIYLFLVAKLKWHDLFSKREPHNH